MTERPSRGPGSRDEHPGLQITCFILSLPLAGLVLVLGYVAVNLVAAAIVGLIKDQVSASTVFGLVLILFGAVCFTPLYRQLLGWPMPPATRPRAAITAGVVLVVAGAIVLFGWLPST